VAEIRKISKTLPDGSTRNYYAWRYRLPDGSWKRVQASTKAALIRKKERLERQRLTGTLPAEKRPESVSEICLLWLEASEAGREGRPPISRVTAAYYRGLIDNHVTPLAIDAGPLHELRAQALDKDAAGAVRDALVRRLSRATAKKVLVILRSAFAWASRQGMVSHDAFASIRILEQRRQAAPLSPSAIPSHELVRKVILRAAERAAEASRDMDRRAWTRRRAMVAMAALAGLRAEELRGLMDRDLDMTHARVTVRQVADRYGTICPPKSAAGYRTLQLSKPLVAIVKEWLLARPDHKGAAAPAHDMPGQWRPGRLLFPNEAGGVLDIMEPINRCWQVLMEDLGAVDPPAKPGGRPRPHYTFHDLRHFYASDRIARGAGPQEIKYEVGHATIQMTFDTYGHLFAFHERDARQRANDAASEVL
jgi:integrase